MTLICASFVAVCFNSFMQARADRKEQEAMAHRDPDSPDTADSDTDSK